MEERAERVEKEAALVVARGQSLLKIHMLHSLIVFSAHLKEVEEETEERGEKEALVARVDAEEVEGAATQEGREVTVVTEGEGGAAVVGQEAHPYRLKG